MDEKQEDKKIIAPSVIDNDLWKSLKKQMNAKSEYETILEKHKLS